MKIATDIAKDTASGLDCELVKETSSYKT